jgi:hypothetical protein
MNPLFPLTPVLKRRGAITLGVGLLTTVAIGGVAANAQTGPGTTKLSRSVSLVRALEAAPVATKTGLPECADLVAGPHPIRITPAQPAQALPTDTVGPGADTVPKVKWVAVMLDGKDAVNLPECVFSKDAAEPLTSSAD